MDAFVDEVLCLLEEGSAQHNHSSRPVTDLVVLVIKKSSNAGLYCI